ncbi:hypothetical protein LA366_15090 [Aeromonas jandaei]|uniref:Uncharacterized protein n=1 Tax=Aeromonas jandaei TaxID=650 RepID=A0A7T4AD01_AERJA|nr:MULTISPECIES: hypothetical protein [Aeromonas]QQB21611.1 hypothetical protein I6H43_08865 [Aeromonas jandaei]UCA32429.1 hypothetical protein LA366_15090 [Aeromonas jandaei]
MELHDTPMLRYLGQLHQPDQTPGTESAHWFLLHRDGGWPLPTTPEAQPVNRLMAEPLR